MSSNRFATIATIDTRLAHYWAVNDALTEGLEYRALLRRYGYSYEGMSRDLTDKVDANLPRVIERLITDSRATADSLEMASGNLLNPRASAMVEELAESERRRQAWLEELGAGLTAV